MRQSVSNIRDVDTQDQTDGNSPLNLAPPLLLQYWQVVIRWKWIIVGIILSSVVLGLVFTLLATPKYTATCKIEIGRGQKKVTNVEALGLNDVGGDLDFTKQTTP